MCAVGVYGHEIALLILSPTWQLLLPTCLYDLPPLPPFTPPPPPCPHLQVLRALAADGPFLASAGVARVQVGGWVGRVEGGWGGACLVQVCVWRHGVCVEHHGYLCVRGGGAW